MIRYLLKGTAFAVVYPVISYFVTTPIILAVMGVFSYYSHIPWALGRLLLCIDRMVWPPGLIIVGTDGYPSSRFGWNALSDLAIAIGVNIVIYLILAALLWVGDKKSELAYIPVGLIVVILWLPVLMVFLPSVFAGLVG